MTRSDDGPLGGLVRRKLIRELAMRRPGETNVWFGNRYGVTGPAITHFAKRHANEIAAVAAKADDEYAGMLITSKAYRLALLEQIVEQAGIPVPKVTPAGKIVHRWNAETGEDEEVMEIDVRAQMQAVKQAAEELGQLPNRVTLSGQIDTTTVYKIVNVSDEDLT
jgi:hypothetical protein